MFWRHFFFLIICFGFLLLGSTRFTRTKRNSRTYWQPVCIVENIQNVLGKAYCQSLKARKLLKLSSRQPKFHYYNLRPNDAAYQFNWFYSLHLLRFFLFLLVYVFYCFSQHTVENTARMSPWTWRGEYRPCFFSLISFEF